MKPLDKVYLDGNVEKGMFFTENAFLAKNYEGEIIEGWFDKDRIKDGKLETTFVKEEGDKVTIISPQYFFGQSQFIQVNKKDIYEKKDL